MRTNTDVRLHFNLEINLTAAPPFPYYNALPATKFCLSQDIPWYEHPNGKVTANSQNVNEKSFSVLMKRMAGE